ncbi:MAG: hypothetical protein Q9Q40_01180 [Acidobacteriota bacterium]|nr:hypothetical protein [Acidobacteriota bacterium]
MTGKRIGILVVVLLLAGGPLAAHEVQHALSRGEAWILTLQTDDGEPFVDQPWILRTEDSGTLVAQGRTDNRGRLAFLPPDPGHYELRAESPDGHGVVLPLDLDAIEAGPAGDAGHVHLPGRRWGTWVSALGYLLGIFGLATMLIGRRR